jgi:hypothetical protein
MQPLKITFSFVLNQFLLFEKQKTKEWLFKLLMEKIVVWKRLLLFIITPLQLREKGGKKKKNKNCFRRSIFLLKFSQFQSQFPYDDEE